MKSFKLMLLGFAFLLIALMGAILYEGDFGYILFIIGAPSGILLCILGCFREEIKAWAQRAKQDSDREDPQDENAEVH